MNVKDESGMSEEIYLSSYNKKHRVKISPQHGRAELLTVMNSTTRVRYG